MKQKIKKLYYGIATLGLSAPMLALGAYVEPSNTNLPGGSITGIITNIMQWILALIGVIAVIAFVIAGILYLTAAGDEDRMQQAKRAMIYAIVGVIVALIGLVILRAVYAMLTGDNNNF